MGSLRQPPPVTIGVDIGQKQDPTAICVAEAMERSGDEHYLVRHLERLPLGTPYPQVADRIHKVAKAVGQRTAQWPTVYVDATGVGQPIIDLLMPHTRCEWLLVAVTFTAGSNCCLRPGEPPKLSLGKEHLASRLQALLRGQQIHLPTTREGSALAAELRGYEVRVNKRGRAKFGAFRSGTHDDLATALGLAVTNQRSKK